MMRHLRAIGFSLVVSGALIGAAAPDLLTAAVSAAPGQADWMQADALAPVVRSDFALAMLARFVGSFI